MATSAVFLPDRNERERLSIIMKNVVVLPGQDKKKYYGNTFKMEPDVIFSSMHVEKLLQKRMHEVLEHHVYDEEKSLKLCITLSADIRNMVSETILHISFFK